jgi:hypothetical protein
VGRLLLSANQWRLQIERTLGRTDLGSGEAEILGRGRKAAMTQQDLNGAHVGTGFQQMDGEGVPKGMRGDRFWNMATLMGLLASLLYGAPRDVAADSITREEPPFGLVHSPPGAQDFEEFWFGESMTSRSLAPLPCCIRMTIRSLSISVTFRQIASETRSPAA